jgi:hypothetical protein
MKKSALFILLVISVQFASAQSRSYQDLQRNFEGQGDVRSFGLGSGMCRLIVSIIGNEEEEVAEALKGVKHVRFMTIPKEEFDNRGLSVRGFRSRLAKDRFELMANFKNSDDNVTVYHRSEEKSDRYFVLIDEHDNLIAIEMKGYIDPSAFKDELRDISL